MNDQIIQEHTEKIVKLIKHNTKLENELIAASNDYKKLQEDLDKTKRDFEKLLQSLLDNRVITSWYYNGGYHWELRNE